MSEPHRFFTAGTTGTGWAIFFEPRPVETPEGRAEGLRWPILRADECLTDPHLTLPRIAAILEERWEHQDTAGTPRP